MALPRSTPSDQSVSAAGVTDFLDTLDALDHIELHSLMVLRHGFVVAEGWWAPYAPEKLHLLYSLSKSFTATACGLAVSEGLLRMDDTVLSHFPEYADDDLGPHARAMTVHHLASMATGHLADTLDRVALRNGGEFVRAFLHLEPEQEPGTVFAYNNGATYTLGRIVQKVTGQSLTNYLRPRLFDPLGIEHTYWDRLGGAYEIGFSGLHLATESVASFGQLFLQRGRWQGAQLLPESWVAEATRVQTPNPAEPNPDWQQGYGYQMWMARHGYRGDGAYGQFCLVWPEQDAVVAITAQTEDMQGLLDAAWAHLLPAFDGPTSAADDQALAARLSAAALPLPQLAGDLPGAPQAADPTVTSAVSVAEAAEGWLLTVTDRGQTLEVPCGDGRWTPSVLDVGNDRVLEVAAAGGWLGDTFVADVTSLQSAHRIRFTVDRTGGGRSATWQTYPLSAGSLTYLALPRGV